MFQDGRYGLRDVMDSHIYRLDNATPLIYWPYANVTNFELSQDVVYATGGKGAPRRISFFGTKEGTITFETQIFSAAMLAIMLGTEAISNESADLYKVNNRIVEDDGGDLKVELSHSPISSDGKEPSAFKFINGVISVPVPIISVTDNIVTLDSSVVNAGEEVQVFYEWTTTSGSTNINISASKNPPYVKLIGDTIVVDELTGAEVPAQFIFHKVRAVPNSTLTMANTGDPSTFSVPMDVFGTDDGNRSDAMVDIIFYDDMEE